MVLGVQAIPGCVIPCLWSWSVCQFRELMRDFLPGLSSNSLFVMDGPSRMVHLHIRPMPPIEPSLLLFVNRRVSRLKRPREGVWGVCASQKIFSTFCHRNHEKAFQPLWRASLCRCLEHISAVSKLNFCAQSCV